ncbi:MAG: hypothetical protein A2X05_03090 [Bacteroidetes bacterium GWE2_41_25]|nr:MAG: hypothetical protein A2X03_16335 [Bacteroidetes bacterium GWA2_40_15]OFX91769.1 MAG: hypothetical protein A2X05_03090 [Bacteroidetes bacterium GWE2_41_25]OFX93456.1 MAG: hypothetical protein A2X06_09035 [Bacteroidetes bacterium GWC2_40_22]HCU21204.1 hypothetical protein [Bacteroidales bacterium]
MKKSKYLAPVLFFITFSINAFAQDSIRVSAGITPGFSIINIDNNSSKFNEYRDLRDGFYLHNLYFNLFNQKNGLFLDAEGNKVFRKDQDILFRIGNVKSRWNLVVNYSGTPHHLSNKAMTPYMDGGNGLYALPALSGITKDGDDATGTPSLVPTVGQMAINDNLLSKYMSSPLLLPVKLGTQRDRTSVALNLPSFKGLKIGVNFMNEQRAGTRYTNGTLGDRPPRTLNVQLPDPMKYNVSEIHASANFNKKFFQLKLDYIFSNFTNKIPTLRWENLFFAPDAGKDYIASVAGTPRNISNFGQRALGPDNFSNSISFYAGIDLPLDSRFNANVALGSMKQNQELLPYSYSTLGGDLLAGVGDGKNWNDVSKLPRLRAEAEMRTIRFDMEYTINPIERLNIRAYMRYYKLENNTPTDQWRYVTQDAANTNGTVSDLNKRYNLAYAYGKQKYGIDLRHYLRFWHTNLGLQIAKEVISRDFREADTDENILNATLRSRPTQRLSLTASYLYGDRNGKDYNYNITSQSYWYDFNDMIAHPDNPQFLFANHPDLRKFDVSDRKRNEFKFSAAYIAFDKLDFSASYRFNNTDYDSNVEKTAPMANTIVTLPNPGDANTLTPGEQLGLLDDKRQNVTVNIQFMPNEKWTLSLFADRELANYDHRGLVFNENARNQPSSPAIQAPNQLGPWSDPNRIYNTSTDEVNNTFGMGLNHEFIPDKLRMEMDFSVSLATVEMDYSGYGSDAAFIGQAWETFAFGFNDPEESKYNQYIFNISLEYNVLKNLIVGLQYSYDQYSIQDWVQGANGPWVEQVGSEYFLRDTSRDNRWGNRLVSMGSYLAPGYNAHMGLLTLAYRF